MVQAWKFRGICVISKFKIRFYQKAWKLLRIRNQPRLCRLRLMFLTIFASMFVARSQRPLVNPLKCAHERASHVKKKLQNVRPEKTFKLLTLPQLIRLFVSESSTSRHSLARKAGTPMPFSVTGCMSINSKKEELFFSCFWLTFFTSTRRSFCPLVRVRHFRKLCS